MALRLWSLLIPLILLTVAQRGDGQSTTPQPQPPSLVPPPIIADKPPTPVPVKELSKQELESLIEKTFGRDCEELRQPICVWLPDIGLVVTAKEASIGRDGRSVRFLTASIGVPDGSAFRGDETVIVADRALTQWNDLSKGRIMMAEVHNKGSIVVLSPNRNANTNFTTMGFKEERVLIERALEAVPERVVVPSDPVVFQASRSLEVRFKFKIDAKATLADLLPTPAKMSAKMPMWTNEDLTKVPELTFGEPISKDLPKQKGMEQTAHVMAKINHLNLKKTDGFMLAMIEKRTDLRGLPFLMGDECRTREAQAKMFAQVAETFSRTVAQAKVNGNGGTGNIDQLWGSFMSGQSNSSKVHLDQLHRALVAASTQILMPESEAFRLGLAKNLATVPHIDATRALARLAIFSPEESVRSAAIDGLKTRREKDYTDVLMEGFRYPLPVVSKRVAEALVKLEQKDMVAKLIGVLESPDPRLPVTEKRDGKDVTFVREMVRVNHHRSCLLCHAPGNTDNTPEGVLKVAVPLSSEPLPKPSDGGGYQSTQPPTPDIVVRLDMTYLRQDFSQMMPVSDSHPWPELQRFDFLVRTRTLTASEAEAYERCCEPEESGRLSPYHRSALFALRELTGRDTEPTAAAWRKLLKLPARN